MRQEVNDRKYQNPDAIDEMPVKPDRLERGRGPRLKSPASASPSKQ